MKGRSFALPLLRWGHWGLPSLAFSPDAFGCYAGKGPKGAEVEQFDHTEVMLVTQGIG